MDDQRTMMTADELDLAARIGLVWADGDHDPALLLAAGCGEPERLRIAHMPEALQEFPGELRLRFIMQAKGAAAVSMLDA